MQTLKPPQRKTQAVQGKVRDFMYKEIWKSADFNRRKQLFGSERLPWSASDLCRDGILTEKEEMDKVFKDRIDKVLAQNHMKHVRADIFSKLMEGRLYEIPDDYAILKNQVFEHLDKDT